jgi:hypothetical protein
LPSDLLNIHINLAALQVTFFWPLQHQLDVIKVLQVGCEQVTAQQVAEQPEFGSFVPANGAQLKHEDAKAEAQDWLLRGLLRDAIEAAGLFLDECLQVCGVLPLAATGFAKAGELHREAEVLVKMKFKKGRFTVPPKPSFDTAAQVVPFAPLTRSLRASQLRRPR